MDINHELIINAFTLEYGYNDIEKAYSFSEEKLERAAFPVFIDELLERYNLLKFAHSYKIKDEGVYNIKYTLKNLRDCEIAVGRKIRIDIYDQDNGEYRVYTCLKTDEKDIIRVLSLSALNYYIDDYNRLWEIEDNLDNKLKEYENES